MNENLESVKEMSENILYEEGNGLDSEQKAFVLSEMTKNQNAEESNEVMIDITSLVNNNIPLNQWEPSQLDTLQQLIQSISDNNTKTSETKDSVLSDIIDAKVHIVVASVDYSNPETVKESLHVLTEEIASQLKNLQEAGPLAIKPEDIINKFETDILKEAENHNLDMGRSDLLPEEIDAILEGLETAIKEQMENANENLSSENIAALKNTIEGFENLENKIKDKEPLSEDELNVVEKYANGIDVSRLSEPVEAAPSLTKSERPVEPMKKQIDVTR